MRIDADRPFRCAARRLRLLPAVACLLLCTATAAVAADDRPARAERVPWQTDRDWSEIRARARDRQAPILIDFTASWCAPCKLLDAMVFNDRDVIAELSDVVPMQVDIDDPAYHDLKAGFNIQRVPTLIWCDSEGREIDRFTGYRSAGDFLRTVALWRADKETFRAVQRRVAARPEAPVELLDLAERLRQRFEYERAEVLYRRLLNLADRTDCLTRVRGKLGLADVAGRTGRGELGRRLALESAQLLGECAEDRIEGLRQVAVCQAALGDTTGLMETWRVLMTLDDRDVAALEGFARAAVHERRELDAAAEAALRAVILSDMEPRIIGTLAECYHLQGRYRRAIRWISKCIEQEPDVEEYRQQLARYEESLRLDPYGYRGVRR